LRGLGGDVPLSRLFSEGRRAHDEGRFWFQNGMYHPEPYHFFDAILVDCALVALSQASARLFALPPSRGFEYRILNGYVSCSAIERETRWSPYGHRRPAIDGSGLI
jgi:hypothetical protein